MQKDDVIYRQAAIDVLSLGKEMLSRVLDDIDVVGTDREKYSWGLGLIESYINDINELPTAQPGRAEGEWVLKDYLWECNKCGCRINVKNPLSYENEWSYFFCPHCGTKMPIAVQRF